MMGTDLATRVMVWSGAAVGGRRGAKIERLGLAALAAMLLSVAAPTVVLAELTCGRDDQGISENSSNWYGTYMRRMDLKRALEKNGNPELAEHFYRCAADIVRRAAERGVPSAQFQYGLMLPDLEPQNPRRHIEAREWVRKAAVAGVQEARRIMPDWERRRP